MKDLMESVIAAFDWQYEDDYLTLDSDRGYGLWIEDEDDSLILFAAYAKAEMAYKGYEVAWYKHPNRVSFTRNTGPNWEPKIEYDPQDPVSEAQALIRCIAEIISKT